MNAAWQVVPVQRTEGGGRAATNREGGKKRDNRP